MKTKKKRKFQVRVYDGSGKRFPAKSFDRKVDADAYRAELLLLRNKGLTQETVRAGEMSFESYTEKWLLECNSHNSEGWKQSQNQMLRDHILPLMKDLKIGSIKKRDIELLINSAKDKGLSPQTQKHIFNLVHKLLKDAFAHFEFILANPAAKVIPPSVPKKSREFLRLSEIKTILEKCNGHWLEPVIWLGICAGMRIGEIQALEWDCVDFENNIITIKASYCRKERRIKDHPKQKDWGSAPIIPDLKRCLLKLRPANADSCFVAQGPDKGMVSHSSLLKALKRLCDSSGVRRVTPHELRHSTSELFMSNGASMEDMRRILNHKSSKITETYVHRTTERVNHVAQQIELNIPKLRVVG